MQTNQRREGGANRLVAALKRGAKVGVVSLMTLSLSGVFSVAAYASEANVITNWSEAAKDATSADYQPYTTLDSGEAAAYSDDATSSSDLPKTYDLRDQGIVTPVKYQNPWGTCWGFSIIAACETSILAEAGTTYKATGLDLSELQLASAIFRNGGAPETLVGALQAGEGYHNASANPNLGLDDGGLLTYGVTVFAAGIGPTLESLAEYRNTGVYTGSSTTHADDPVYMVTVIRKAEDGKTSDGTDADQAADAAPTTSKETVEYLTQSQIDALDEDESVISCKKKCYAGNYYASDGTRVYTDWTIASQYDQSLDEDDLSWWNSSLLNLENGNELPDTRNLDANGKFVSVNWDAVDVIKNELYDSDGSGDADYSRAVSICFAADNSRPGDQDNEAKYISAKWAHYTNDNAELNHAVTIVGWDDTYSKENFAAGFKDAAAHTPAGDGAWLVKNSWGSETGDSFDSENFPSAWGIEDENGNHTGYFWISYYDTSLCMGESYDFDINSYSDNTEYVADQYDYLAADSAVVMGSETPLYSANVFTAEADMDVRTLSCATYKPNTTVTYRVYLLDSSDAEPGDSEHSTLAYTCTDEYELGGYHRTTLDQDKWIPMREGQSYAVVTSQQTADGLYYQGVAINMVDKLSEEELEEYAKEHYGALEKFYKNLYTDSLKEYYETDEGKKELEERGLTPEEALPIDLAKNMEEDGVYDTIEARVKAAKELRQNVYFEAKVNEGESLSGASSTAASEDGTLPADIEWADWTGVVTAVKDEYKKQGSNVAVDNAPVKTFAEIDDFAEVSELTSLKEAVAAAKELLASVVVSEDGTDVSTDKKWMTRADYDALKAAIEEAEQMLATAGDDYETVLHLGTAGSDEVNAQSKALAGFSAQAGTKKGSVEPSGKSDGEPSGKPTNKGGLPTTGDAASGTLVVLVSFAGVAGASAYLVRRRYNS